MKVKLLTNGEHIEEVSSFKYVGVIVHADGTSQSEIRAKIELDEKSGQILNLMWQACQG